MVQEVGGGGEMEPLPRVFDMLQYFETMVAILAATLDFTKN